MASPWERIQQKQIDEVQETLAKQQAAINDPYALIRVSQRRYRVMRRTSTGHRNQLSERGTEYVTVPYASWEFVSEPLDWADACQKLAALRTGQV